MRIAHFDCSSGIAGNMVLGALLDAGVDLTYLKQELHKLQITPPAADKLQITKVRRGLIHGTFVNVKIKKDKHHRHLKDILSIIKKSKLSKNVKKLSVRIFKRLAEAEAKVHGVPINKIHFHEVGAVDAIIDIVGTAICLEKLGIEKVYASPIPHGKGTFKHAHGILPIPAPATAQLLKSIPTYGINLGAELVTPTGAAIISTIASDFCDLPRMRLQKIGYGAGSLTFPKLSNFLRVFIGEAEIAAERDVILQIEANIDDMNPKAYHRAIAKLMKAGALDAYVTPIIMKKKRKAINLVVLCRPEQRNKMLDKIFSLTTTLGVRIYVVAREKLSRKFKKTKTKHGKVKVKLGYLGKELKTAAPEYEDLKRLAKKYSVPLKW
ncbi:MAG: nickel pincer cofactor biosynthesis protein LarC [Candidatus Saganbacteria bacterium]|nr:nickel pincer cofactor biosynthesis protein LarC [Candidatus Saganbacteria bacterium]